jgi:DNA-binding LacI/PurR family transcriptional regulator
LSLGHRCFACIAGPEVIQPGDNRLVGFKKALGEAGVLLDDSRILRGDFRSESAYRLALDILEWDTAPTAIFTFNDLMAFGAITALSERGIRVPEDVSVVGYDNIEQASYFNPRLTTVAQPHREMGEMAVAKLIERIADKNLPARTFHLSPCLVTRNSTAPARNKWTD